LNSESYGKDQEMNNVFPIGGGAQVKKACGGTKSKSRRADSGETSLFESKKGD